jgi:group I intron endonuclease
MITYIARNTMNGKFYIGSTINFNRRKNEHLKSNSNYPFHIALRKTPDCFEWEVIEDDSEERILEQSLLDMWYGKEMCYNLSPTANCPSTNFEANYKIGMRVKELKLGFHNPEYINSFDHKKMLHETGKKCFENEIGIHSKEYKKSDKPKMVGRMVGLVIGKQNYENKIGIFSPEYRNSQKFIDDNKKRIERSKEVCSKSIIIISPNGDKFIFYSMQEAERKLGIKNQTVSRLAKRGTPATKGKWKGWRVMYNTENDK